MFNESDNAKLFPNKSNHISFTIFIPIIANNIIFPRINPINKYWDKLY